MSTTYLDLEIITGNRAELAEQIERDVKAFAGADRYEVESIEVRPSVTTVGWACVAIALLCLGLGWYLAGLPVVDATA